MADPHSPRSNRFSTRALIGAAVAAAIVTLGVVALLVNIFERVSARSRSATITFAARC
jgi:hypothetical protein